MGVRRMNEVKSPKKPLMYYYTIVLILLLVFNFVAMPWISEHQIKKWITTPLLKWSIKGR